jgi:hypothetical protein
MNSRGHISREEVAVRHRATSAQPPRATSLFPQWFSSQHAPQPFPSTVVLDTPGALLEGLRCCPAAYPLLLRLEVHARNDEGFSRDSK